MSYAIFDAADFRVYHFSPPYTLPRGRVNGETKAAILALSEVVRTVWKNEKFGGNSRRLKGAPAWPRFAGQTTRLSDFPKRCLPGSEVRFKFPRSPFAGTSAIIYGLPTILELGTSALPCVAGKDECGYNVNFLMGCDPLIKRLLGPSDWFSFHHVNHCCCGRDELECEAACF